MFTIGLDCLGERVLQLKTVEEVKEEFRFYGQTITGWASKHDVNPDLVRRILRGGRRCVRGESHKIAVLLGIKEGEIVQ